MAISVAQRTLLGNAAATSTVAKAFTSNLTAGNASIVIATSDGALTTLSSCIGSQGITYTPVAALAKNSFSIKVWIAYNMGAAAETATVTTGFNDSNIFIFEAAGLASNYAFDQYATQIQASATSLSSGNTGQLFSPNSLLIGINANTLNPGLAPTVGAGFGNLQTLTTNFNGGGSEEQVVSANTAVAATFGLAANGGSELTAIFVFSDTAIRRKFTTTNLRPHPFSPGLAR